MVGKQQPRFPINAVVDFIEVAAQHALLEQFFLEPDRDRLAEGLKAPRREREISLEQALEFEKRLFVEHDVVEFISLDPRRLQAIAHGDAGKSGIVLAAREAFFLRGGDDLAVNHERRGAVVVEC